jgi:transposase-like protein
LIEFIIHNQESLRALSKRYGINQKTVAKWKRRTAAADLPTGPREPRSTVLSVDEEAVIVAFRRIPCCRSTTASTAWQEAGYAAIAMEKVWAAKSCLFSFRADC